MAVGLGPLLGAARVKVQVGCSAANKNAGTALALLFKIVSQTIGLWSPLG